VEPTDVGYPDTPEIRRILTEHASTLERRKLLSRPLRMHYLPRSSELADGVSSPKIYHARPPGRGVHWRALSTVDVDGRSDQW